MTTGTNLENMILSERSQTRKTAQCRMPFTGNCPDQANRAEGALEVALGVGERGGAKGFPTGVMTMF